MPPKIVYLTVSAKRAILAALTGFNTIFYGIETRLMYKKPLEISCYVAGAGAFGVFFRWLQDQLAFDENGLNEKSFFNFLVPALVIAAMLLFRHFVNAMKQRRLAPPEDFCHALYNPGKLFTILRWTASVVMIAGAVLLMMSSEADLHADLMRVLCLLAALSGLAFPLVLGQANYDSFGNQPLVRIGTMLPVVMYAFWLVLSYLQNQLNSVPWSFAVEMFTLICAMLGFFRAAGFAFFSVDGYKALFWTMMGSAACIMSLADERYMGMQLMLLASAGMLLLYVWILVRNLERQQNKADGPEANEGGFEKVN